MLPVMLPIQLSANICSLNPLVDRCAMVVRLDYTEEGDLKDVGYAAAVIKSKTGRFKAIDMRKSSANSVKMTM